MEEDNLTKLIKIIMKQKNLNIGLNKQLIKRLVDYQIKSNLSMSKLSNLTKCCLNLSKQFPNLNEENNLTYLKKLLGNDKDIIIPEPILDKVNEYLNTYDNQTNFEEEKIYFNSQSLRELIANMYICMICHINVCLVGKTGIGKTHLAQAFSHIFLNNDDSNLNNILFTFNSESTIENLYGTFAFEGGKTIIVEGPLYNFS